MKTLVIHPDDMSTNFLSLIYEDMEHTLINDTTISKKELKEQIKIHDRIIMLGHGTEEGLLTEGYRFIIDSTFVYLLREKNCICIWCNADVFVNKYKLKGLYTGMIISENEEANMYCINATIGQIVDSNIQFAEAVRDSINKKETVKEYKKLYSDIKNPIVDFNRNNLFYNK